LSTGVFKKATRSLFGTAPEAPVKPRATKPAKPVMSYHAVTIAVGARSCAGAQALQEKRFLSREAPKLPLATCDLLKCECRYTHHADRRRGPRRAREMGVALDAYADEEKRGGPKRGRRKNDK
jgi:hypothetical protein